MATDADSGALRLNRDDVQRVAEFFDCDVYAALEFARKVWLPDANQTATRLTRAIRTRDSASAVYLCDKLREGARCVGATRIMEYASEIERAVRNQNWRWLRKRTAHLRRALDAFAGFLLNCDACGI